LLNVAHAKGKLLLAHRQTESVWGWVLVQAGSAKVRNVGGNQLRLSAGRAGGSELRLPFGSYSTRRFALRGI